MRALWIAGTVLVACGSSSLQGQGASTDAAAGSSVGSNTGSGTDVVDAVTCQTHTHTATGSDGARQVDDTRFAIMDSVSPGDTFSIEQCDGVETVTSGSNTTVAQLWKPNIPTCPTGSTCAESGAPYPAVAHGCSWSSGAGTFWDGKLLVYCGSTTTVYTAQGAVSLRIDINYGTVRVHH